MPSRRSPAGARNLAGGNGGVDRGRTNAELPQRVDLVLHQRDQRRDDHPDARPQQRRNLVAERLAAAGGHEDKRVSARDHLLDDLRLLAAKRGIAVGRSQHAQRFIAARRGAGFAAGLGRGHGNVHVVSTDKACR